MGNVEQITGGKGRQTMKYDNMKYFIFGTQGELLEGNEIIVHENNIALIELNDVVTIETYDCPLNRITVTTGQTFLPGVSIRSKTKHFGCGDISLHDISIGDKQYGGIVHHDCFDSVGFHVFYEWFKFFLPKSEPTCYCKEQFNEVWLPYANKAMKSMVEYFELQHVYGNAVITKDLKVEC